MKKTIPKWFLLYIVHKEVNSMKKWLFFTFVLFFSFLLWQAFVYFENAMEPKNVLGDKAEAIIKRTYNVEEIQHIESYAGLSKPYQVAEVTTKSNKKVYIWVSIEDNETYIININEGVKKEEALEKVKEKEDPKKIIRVTPGLEGNKNNRSPVWEVVFIDQKDRYTFYYLDFRTGEYLQSYRLNKDI
jgi:uncharacterized protein YpmB